MTALRIVMGTYLLVHGFCHLVGFVVPWRLMTLKEEPYKTTILGGAVNVGDMGIRLIGILWLLAALAFIAAAIGAFTLLSWWLPLTLYLSIFSLVLCILGLPGAKIGILANALILLYLLFSQTLQWLPSING